MLASKPTALALTIISQKGMFFMRRRRFPILCTIVTICLLISNFSVVCSAAGKTVSGYKSTYYSGTADAYEMVYGVKNYDGSYSTTYKEASQVSNSDFYDKSNTIKYWAAHGNNTGRVYGESNSTDINIFSDYNDFSWAGGNLEFVFLAVCKQLDGLGSNPRAEYARAMIGNNAVRTVCGYHEAAPSGIDDDIARKFLEYAKTGESVKSSWMLANTYYADMGWSSRDYLVLTHSGDVQYSRFEGFPGLTYSRPNASSTTILRFSSTGSNTQPLCEPTTVHGLQIFDNVDELMNIDIPSSSLIANPYYPSISRSGDQATFTDGHAVSSICKEIGDSPVSMSEVDALSRAQDWFEQEYSNLPSEVVRTANIEVTPIVMAEVNLDGGPEQEYIVAYSVNKHNTYNGIPIIGDHCNVIVDDDGTVFTSIQWSDYSEIENDTSRSAEYSISFEDAAAAVSNYLNTSTKYLCSIESSESALNNGIPVETAELVYAFNSEAETYQPCWRFTIEGYAAVLVNCFSGSIYEM